jgi:peptide/nickel transport system substrate-binding protein
MFKLRLGSRTTRATSAIAVACLVSACGSHGGGPAGAPISVGGALTVGSDVSPPALDPTANAAAAITEVVDYNVYQHLVQLDPKGKLVPGLAASYQLSRDGKTYTFALRPGVKFSNGDPLTADDVVFSLKRPLRPSSTYPNKGAMADVVRIKKRDESTVAVTLSRRDNQFLYQLAAYSNGVVLDPDAVGKMATEPVGTGPYMVADFRPNYSLTLKRNPHYWGAKSGPETVVFRYFSNANAQISALKSGQIQVIDRLPNPIDAKQFQSNQQFRIIAGPTTGKIQLTLNNQYGPLKNRLVRQALSYAIDRKAIVETTAAGYGTVIGTNTHPGDPWYSPSFADRYAYDPEKAKQLLAQAGYPNGFGLTLTLPPYGYAQSAGPLVAANLKAIGVNVTIKNIEWPLWLSTVFTNHNFQTTIVNQALGRDTFHYALDTYYWQYPHTKQAGQLLNTATEAPSTTGMVSSYRRLLEFIQGDAVNVWLYNPAQITVAANSVHGLPTSGLAASFDLSHVSLDAAPAAALRQQGYSD